MTSTIPRPVADTSQVRHPWRATIRTIVALVIALATVWATVVEAAGVDPGLPVVAASIAVAGAVTRVMALPGVLDLLDRFAPWLLPEPRSLDDVDTDDADTTTSGL